MQFTNELDEFNKKMVFDSLSQFANRRVVIGEGEIGAKIMLIGEAPGGDEEKEGRPFVGKAGKNLMNFLRVIGLERKNLYISNVVKIRPYRLSPKTGKPVNRPPNLLEKNFYTEYLHKEIEIVRPQVIVTLGNVPLQAVLKNKAVTIGDYHGQITVEDGKRIFPLYHPAAIIYNGNLKKIYDSDILKLRDYICSLGVEV